MVGQSIAASQDHQEGSLSIVCKPTIFALNYLPSFLARLVQFLCSSSCCCCLPGCSPPLTLSAARQSAAASHRRSVASFATIACIVVIYFLLLDVSVCHSLGVPLSRSLSLSLSLATSALCLLSRCVFA